MLTLLAGSGSPVVSQVTTATLYGTVTDPSGSAVSGAIVTLTHEETNSAVSRVVDQQGEFTFDFLRVGTYTVRIQATGFKRHELRGLELGSAQTVRRTFPLELGAVTETVNVDATAPLVSTASSEQMQTFEGMKVTELPLARRNVSSVLRLAPGVDSGTGRSPHEITST
jgi:hypothetical protein